MTDPRKPGEGSTSGPVGTASEPIVPWIAAEQHEVLVGSRRAAEGTRRRPRSRLRRSQVSQRAGMAFVAAAGLSGVATVGSATGASAVDRLLRGGLAALLTAAAMTAPTWAIVVLATSAGALGLTAGPLAATSGMAALVLALLLAWKEEGLDRHLLKAACSALAVTALLRVPGGPLGATAAATGALVGLTALSGRRGRSRRWRRRVALAAAGALGLGALATVLGAVAGLTARSSFERSSTSVATALSAARGGDSEDAAESARAAVADLRQARSSVRTWWARPGWAVPVVGAHLRAADQVSASAAPAVEAAASSAGALRADVLRPSAGRLDLARLSAAEPELVRLSKALRTAGRGADEARSPWLAAPLQRRLDRYDTELTGVTVAADRSLLAVRALPGLLGRDRPTRWFVAIANPAEARELGGFVGEYAILVADQGSLRLDRSGGVRDIGAYLEGRNLGSLDLPRRYVSQKPEVYWQNLTGYPDMPTVASTARVLWDQVAPGMPLDGVVYVDPHGLAALLRLTGPVQAPEPLGTLSAANAAQVLLSDQYARLSVPDQLQRKDILQQVAKSTFTALSTAPLPAPAAVGEALGPAVRGGHLLATSFSPEGQQLFDEIGLDGRLPAAVGGDLASLRTSNLLENKLDAHLRRSVRYRAVVNPGDGSVTATATIELRSDATAELTDYVAGNTRGLPKGTHLIEVAWYSGLGLTSMEVDGRAASATSDRDRGWWTHSSGVQIPPGGSTTVVLHLAGKLAATAPYRLAVAPQASVHDDSYVVEVVGSAGWTARPVSQPRQGERDEVLVQMQRR